MSKRSEIEGAFGPATEVTVVEPSGNLRSLKDWFQVFRIIQASFLTAPNFASLKPSLLSQHTEISIKLLLGFLLCVTF